jgi:integrase
VRGQLKQPKTSSGRRKIALSEKAIEALTSQLLVTDGVGTVFRDSRDGKDWKSDQALRKCFWYPALERAGVETRNP